MAANNEQMKLRHSIFIALVVAILAAVAAYAWVEWLGFGNYPREPFFDLAAQTIPILLVALAVEAQARRFDLSTTGKSVRIVAVIFLAVGETFAILYSASLITPEPGTFAADLFVVLTTVGLLGGFLAVIGVAVATPSGGAEIPGLPQTAPPPLQAQPSPPPPRQAAGPPVATGLLVGLLMVVIAAAGLRR